MDSRERTGRRWRAKVFVPPYLFAIVFGAAAARSADVLPVWAALTLATVGLMVFSAVWILWAMGRWRP